MCQPITCTNCGKTTWSGCGEHVAEVKAMVPNDQWCNGHAHEPVASGQGGPFGTLIGR